MRFHSIAAILALASVGAHASAAQYQFVDLGVLTGSSSSAISLNNAGQVVGYYQDTLGHQHGFLWQNGAMSDIGSLGGVSTVAHGINGAGQITGFSGTPTVNQAFLWSPAVPNGAVGTMASVSPNMSIGSGNAINSSGVIAGAAGPAGPGSAEHAAIWDVSGEHDLGAPGQRSSASDINDSGDVAGNYGDARTAPLSHAFLLHGTTFTDLGAIDGGAAQAEGLNAADTVVGESEISAGAFHATRWSNGSIEDLGVLGKLDAYGSSAAFSVNNLGAIVGQSTTSLNNTSNPATNQHAFLYQNGVMTDLNSVTDFTSPGYVLTSARDINSQGQIVGTALFGRVPHAFLLIPNAPSVPEPAAPIALMIGSLGIVMLARYRKPGSRKYQHEASCDSQSSR